MNRQLKKKWTQALRSGEYPQTTRVLHDDNGYCCLGVLCELYRRETDEGHWARGEVQLGIGKRIAYRFEAGDDGMYQSIPDQVLNEVGLQASIANTLALHNDNGKTFGQIADLLDAVGPRQLNDNLDAVLRAANKVFGRII